jgi:signal transduction histidine kinase
VSEERATLIEQLQTANAALEQARQRDAEVATLRERERIARDMHDNLGHTLVAMTVQLEAIQRLYKVDAQRGDAQVDQLKQLTRESMAALRRSLDGLRAPGLGQRALPRALHQLSVEVGQRSSLNVRCFVDESASELRHELAEAVWGVAQEALTNIEKHAGAKQAEIELRVSADDVTLRLSDDGVGIPPDVLAQPGKPGHYGLLGMRERVVQLGGTLFVQTKPDARGTHIQVTLPK